jgi:hypothetical protein
MNGPINQTARFTGSVVVTVQTNPVGRSFTVDGTTYTSAQTFDWIAGASHSIGAPSPQGSRYVWRDWTDGGAATHTVTPAADTTYTASFSLQYYLTMNAYGFPYGTVTPAPGWYDEGATISINASRPGYLVTGWSGYGLGSYTGPNNPASITMNGPITQTPSSRLVLKPDFNSNGHSEVLWQNNITGQRAIWWMNGSDSIGDHFFPTVGTDWHIATTGDFNADGHHDIVWQNNVNGQRAIWLMNGVQSLGDRWLPTVSTQWQIAASGDFNYDGQTDLVWQNTSTGQRAIWWMNGTTKIGEYFLPTVPTDWELVAAASFNGDVYPDLLWQNRATGQRVIWLMSGPNRSGERLLATTATDWKIAGTGDYNADGQPDIAWQNTSTGERAIWLMNGLNPAGDRFLATVPTEWSITNH